MESNIEVIRHKVFRYQYDNLRPNGDIKKEVDKKLNMISTNPEQTGEALRYLPPHLAGKIKRIHIFREGHRLIFKFEKEKRELKILFITPERKKEVDYNQLPFEIFMSLEETIDERLLKKFRVQE